jgi:hypothetical protein
MQRERALITILDTKTDIPVMFNPTDYTVTSSGVFDEKKSKDLFFKEAKIEDFVVKLIFDTYEKHDKNESGTDVRKITEPIAKLIMPTEAGADSMRPPVCLFSWGRFYYKGVVFRIDQKFILFLPNGTPVREELTVSFKSVMTKDEYLKCMGFEACRKTWLVKSGDRLDIIAEKELKNASLWRKIAQENHIDDPLLFPRKEDIGRRIIIPD